MDNQLEFKKLADQYLETIENLSNKIETLESQKRKANRMKDSLEKRISCLRSERFEMMEAHRQILEYLRDKDP